MTKKLVYRDSLLYAGEDILVNAPHGDYVFCVITNNQEGEITEPKSTKKQPRRMSRQGFVYLDPATIYLSSVTRFVALNCSPVMRIK